MFNSLLKITTYFPAINNVRILIYKMKAKLFLYKIIKNCEEILSNRCVNPNSS